MSRVTHIFVLGNSRSGTTMMGRILSRNNDIFTFRELHFFGGMWSSSDSGKLLNLNDSRMIFSKLLRIQDDGIFSKKELANFDKISHSVLNEETYTSLQIFEKFLSYICVLNDAKISCDQTPRNIFYIREILDIFPEARVINMVRDPRDVLLSQKNKWKRRYLGASSIPFIESVRSYFNYHPIAISKIWNSSISTSSHFKNHPRVSTIYFEDLLLNPRDKISEVCDFLEVHFSEEMMNIPNIGSSTSEDKKSSLKIDKSKIGKWKNGGLHNHEIYICEKICKHNMITHKYEMKKIRFFPFLTLLSILIFPIKMIVSFLLNLNRVRNLKELINKRIFNK